MRKEKPEESAEEEAKIKKPCPDKPLDVEEARARFREAADEFSLLGIVKRRPLASVGVAFAAGFGMSMLGASKSTPTAMATASQIIGLVAQFAPLIAARARSSDG